MSRPSRVRARFARGELCNPEVSTRRIEVAAAMACGGESSCAIGRLMPGQDNYSCRYDPKSDVYKSVPQLFLMQRAMRGLLDTAARFVPDLAPLVAGFLESPVTLPPSAFAARRVN